LWPERRRLGHDVLTSLDAGRANFAVPDLEVLGFAAAEGRIFDDIHASAFLYQKSTYCS
jgi:hypothetical protein